MVSNHHWLIHEAQGISVLATSRVGFAVPSPAQEVKGQRRMMQARHQPSVLATRKPLLLSGLSGLP